MEKWQWAVNTGITILGFLFGWYSRVGKERFSRSRIEQQDKAKERQATIKERHAEQDYVDQRHMRLIEYLQNELEKLRAETIDAHLTWATNDDKRRRAEEQAEALKRDLETCRKDLETARSKPK